MQKEQVVPGYGVKIDLDQLADWWQLTAKTIQRRAKVRKNSISSLSFENEYYCM